MGWGRTQRERYTAEDYHKPSDEVKEWWDLSGGIEDLELYLRHGAPPRDERRMAGMGRGERVPGGPKSFEAVRKKSNLSPSHLVLFLDFVNNMKP